MAESNTGWLTERQVATTINMTVAALRKWRILNEGPEFRRFGRSVRYSQESLQNWISGCERGGAPERRAA